MTSPVATQLAPPPALALPVPPRRWALLRETVLVVALLAAYDGGRVLAGRRATRAFEHAHALWDLERDLHLPSEQAVQAAVTAVPDLVRAANVYYASVHFPLTFALLCWLFVRRPAFYLWARRSLVGATAAALAVQALLPTAPPRMLPALGLVDTGAVYGQSVYGPVGKDPWSNQFAAMPSMHVGWALLVAVVAVAATRTPWRWMWALHPLLTVMVVVVTGNHYWMDSAAGAALVVAALVAFGAVPHRRVREPVQR